jgi:hypothetical protein
LELSQKAIEREKWEARSSKEAKINWAIIKIEAVVVIADGV